MIRVRVEGIQGRPPFGEGWRLVEKGGDGRRRVERGGEGWRRVEKGGEGWRSVGRELGIDL